METTWLFIIAGIIVLFFLLSHTIYITTSNVPTSSTAQSMNRPVCGTTPYGCCPDGINYKMNFMGSNCPSSPQNPYTVGSNTGPNPYLKSPVTQPVQMPGSSTAPILPIQPKPTPVQAVAPTAYVASNVSCTTPYPNNPMLLPQSTSMAPIIASQQALPPVASMPPHQNPYNIP